LAWNFGAEKPVHRAIAHFSAIYYNSIMEAKHLRLDKYLKVSRLMKRRTLANEACSGGKVSIGGKPAKPGDRVKPGDILEIRLGERIFRYEVLSAQEHASKEEAENMYRAL
jgi:ribosomal 50S subunit-recycling heat shock protein